MSEWKDISGAPTDGRPVYVKRVYEGRVIKEGWAVWSAMSSDAPMRQSAPGGLYGPIPPDNDFADEARWLNEDRRFSFPAPTHWMPEPPNA